MHDAAPGASEAKTENGTADRPVDLQLIGSLMVALELARTTDDAMLPRLIEVVLLHAGRVLERGIDPAMFF